MRTDAFANPTLVVHIVMLGWFPVCMAMLATLGAMRGVILGLVTGLFLLPNAAYDLPGVPPYDKMTAICAGVTVAALVFDSKRMLALRPRWIDLPVAVFCCVPFISAVAAGEMGAWFGLSESFGVSVTWGLAWVLGRVYLSNPVGQRWFARCFVGAALVYLPLCAWEIKMSPQLHELVYGIRLKSFKHAIRAFGWRPNVFIEHGLMAGMVLSMAALTAFWTWTCKLRRETFGMPSGLVFLALAALTVATQSSGALVLLFVGVGCLSASRVMRWRFQLAVLVALPLVYVGLRYGLDWKGEQLVGAAESIFGERRANSLQYRLDNENALAERAKLKPWLGWGAIASFTGNDDEGFNAIIDSLWTILVGVYGYLGFLSGFGTLLIAPFLVWKRLPVRAWSHPQFCTLALFGVMLTLYAADCLVNAFPNPLFVAVGAGVAQSLGTKEGLRLWSMQGGPPGVPGPPAASLGLAATERNVRVPAQHEAA